MSTPSAPDSSSSVPSPVVSPPGSALVEQWRAVGREHLEAAVTYPPESAARWKQIGHAEAFSVCADELEAVAALSGAEIARLQAAASHGVAFCSFCGWSEKYDNTEPFAQSLAATMLAAHVRQCKEHPLIKRAEAAEAECASLKEENQELRADKAFWDTMTTDERVQDLEAECTRLRQSVRQLEDDKQELLSRVDRST